MNGSTFVILLVLAAVAVVAVRSYRKKLSGGCCGGDGETVKRVRVADRNAAHYAFHRRVGVDGMVCANCARRVENAFNRREGVYARVDGAQHCAYVHSKEPLADAEIRRIVSEAGYSALTIEEVAQ